MSYVLEALKKAQAQREQGGVPGIHSLQVPYVAVEGKARSNLKPVLWSIAVLLVFILALMAWRMSANTAAPETKPSGAPSATQGGLVEPMPPVVQAAPAFATPPLVPAPVSESLSKGEVQVPVSASAERAAAKKKALAASNEAAKSPARTVAKVEAKTSPERRVGAGAESSAPRVYTVAELPEGVRRELPTLVISGGSYSSNPAQRLIIVNNQVFTESSQPVPGVVVERIEPTTAVLSFKGYSYRVGY